MNRDQDHAAKVRETLIAFASSNDQWGQREVALAALDQLVAERNAANEAKENARRAAEHLMEKLLAANARAEREADAANHALAELERERDFLQARLVAANERAERAEKKLAETNIWMPDA